jgi:hypothetical protein
MAQLDLINSARRCKELATFFRAQIRGSRLNHGVSTKHIKHSSDWNINDVFNRKIVSGDSVENRATVLSQRIQETTFSSETTTRYKFPKRFETSFNTAVRTCNLTRYYLFWAAKYLCQWSD